MKIFTNEALRKIDNETIAADGITQLDLMERAASAVTFEIMSRWRTSQRMIIFAGPGNNGGDALAVARMLYEQGYQPEVYLFNVRSSNLSECCATNRQRLLDLGDIDFTEIVDNFTPPELSGSDVVIDGLFGSGLHSSQGWLHLACTVHQQQRSLYRCHRHAFRPVLRVERGQ